MLESQIKKKCTGQLEKWGWLVIHLIQTNCNGVPDTIILRSSKAFFIEFKQQGKAPRKLQSYRIRKLLDQGFETIVVTDLKDIQHLK
jgi:hypothetical protein